MKYVYNAQYKYVDQQGAIFQGVIPRDLVVGDQYEAYGANDVKKVMEVTDKVTDENGFVIVNSKEVL